VAYRQAFFGEEAAAFEFCFQAQAGAAVSEGGGGEGELADGGQASHQGGVADAVDGVGDAGGAADDLGGLLRGHSQRTARPSPPDGRALDSVSPHGGMASLGARRLANTGWPIGSPRSTAATFCSGGALHRALAELGLDTRDAIGFTGSAAISLEITFSLISAKLQITAHENSLTGRFS
jgi:hypothetical protein